MRAFDNEWIFQVFEDLFGRQVMVLVEPTKTGRVEVARRSDLHGTCTSTLHSFHRGLEVLMTRVDIKPKLDRDVALKVLPQAFTDDHQGISATGTSQHTEEVGIGGPMHLPHAAFADLGGHRVGAEAGADGQGHSLK